MLDQTAFLYVCGGIIITEWHILTAAHCVCDIELGPIKIVTKQVNVTVGEHNPADGKDEGGQKIEVAQRICHNFTLITLDNDIAILRLKEKIQHGNNVDLIDWRDSPSAKYEGKEATAIGWGDRENNTVNPPHFTVSILFKV